MKCRERVVSLLNIIVYSSIIEIGRADAQPIVNLTNPIAKSSVAEIVESILLWTLSVAGSITFLMLVTG